jgi:hypothetical protein
VRWVASSAVVLAACGAAEARPPPAPVPEAPAVAPVAVPPDAGVPVAEPEATASELRLEPVPGRPAPDPLPVVEIAFPFAAQTIPIAKAARYVVRLKLEAWSLGKPGERGVELALDDFRPRRAHTQDQPIRLGDLVPEDQTLEPGEHLLRAIAVHENGETVKPAAPVSRAPFALVHFWVGPKSQARVDSNRPMLFYSQPRGTYNGDAAADSALVDYYLVNAQLGEGGYSVRVRVQGEGLRAEARLRRWQPLAIPALPSGDFDTSIELLGPDGQPVQGPYTSARRTITVNRDAPVPEG